MSRAPSPWPSAVTSERWQSSADILVIPHATYYPPETSVAENEDVSSRHPVHTLPPPSWTMSHFGSPPRELLKGLACLVQRMGRCRVGKFCFSGSLWSIRMGGCHIRRQGLQSWTSGSPYSLKSTMIVWEPPYPNYCETISSDSLNDPERHCSVTQC